MEEIAEADAYGNYEKASQDMIETLRRNLKLSLEQGWVENRRDFLTGASIMAHMLGIELRADWVRK